METWICVRCGMVTLVRRIGAAVARYDFDRIHGGWVDAVVTEGAKETVARSVERYAGAVEGGVD